jgi:hypothetical protein
VAAAGRVVTGVEDGRMLRIDPDGGRVEVVVDRVAGEPMLFCGRVGAAAVPAAHPRADLWVPRPSRGEPPSAPAGSLQTRRFEGRASMQVHGDDGQRRWGVT